VVVLGVVCAAGVELVVELVDVAALAIAAPPPASAPVIARVVRSGFRFRMLVHLLVFRLGDTFLAHRRTGV
jgi:hypothetical protein